MYSNRDSQVIGRVVTEDGILLTLCINKLVDEDRNRTNKNQANSVFWNYRITFYGIGVLSPTTDFNEKQLMDVCILVMVQDRS